MPSLFIEFLDELVFGTREAAWPMIKDDLDAEVRQIMENLKAVAEAAGGGLGSIIKANIYLTDLGDFAIIAGAMQVAPIGFFCL